jgi:membrane protein
VSSDPEIDDRSVDDQSVGELVQEASRQLTHLVRQELQLARRELQDKGRHAGRAAGLVGGAGLVALYGLGAVVAAAILGLATAIEPWAAALVVAAVLLAVAGVLALAGRRQVQEAVPPVPAEAAESVQEDVRYLKERTAR